MWRLCSSFAVGPRSCVSVSVISAHFVSFKAKLHLTFCSFLAFLTRSYSLALFFFFFSDPCSFFIRKLKALLSCIFSTRTWQLYILRISPPQQAFIRHFRQLISSSSSHSHILAYSSSWHSSYPLLKVSLPTSPASLRLRSATFCASFQPPASV